MVPSVVYNDLGNSLWGMCSGGTASPSPSRCAGFPVCQLRRARKAASRAVETEFASDSIGDNIGQHPSQPKAGPIGVSRASHRLGSCPAALGSTCGCRRRDVRAGAIVEWRLFCCTARARAARVGSPPGRSLVACQTPPPLYDIRELSSQSDEGQRHEDHQDGDVQGKTEYRVEFSRRAIFGSKKTQRDSDQGCA
jgi:hypothetical protein